MANTFNMVGGGSASLDDMSLCFTSIDSVKTVATSIPCKNASVAIVLNDEIHFLGRNASGSPTTAEKKRHYKWSGNAWTSVSTLPYNFYNVSSAVVLNGEIHILGSQQSSNYKSHYKWDGTAWVNVSTLPYNYDFINSLFYIFVFNGEIYVYFSSNGLYKWNGSAWTQVITVSQFSSVDGDITAICVYNNNIYASYYNDINGSTLNKWNGAAFNQVHMGIYDNINYPFELNGKLYGYHDDIIDIAIYEYDETTGEYNSVFIPNSEVVSYLPMVLFREEIYYLNGNDLNKLSGCYYRR